MKTLKNILTPTDLVFLCWTLAASILVLFRRNDPPHVSRFLVIFGAAFVVAGVIFFLLRNVHSQKKPYLIARYAYAPFLFALQFESVQYLDRMYFNELLDPWFIRLDEMIFGMQPSVTFWHAMPWDFMSEIMNLSYFLFYPMFAFLILYPLFKGRMDDFLSVIFVIVFSFNIFYLIYYVIPVAGPRIYLTEAMEIPRNGYIFNHVMVAIYRAGGITGAAFPSSHCGMATVNTLLAWKFIKGARVPMTIITVFLILATVYLRYHYAVDSIAGIMTGVMLYLGGTQLLKTLRKSGFKWPSLIKKQRIGE